MTMRTNKIIEKAGNKPKCYQLLKIISRKEEED